MTFVSLYPPLLWVVFSLLCQPCCSTDKEVTSSSDKRIWYVAKDGLDFQGCGMEESPCKTLEQILLEEEESTNEIHMAPHKKHTYLDCTSLRLEVNGSLVLSGSLFKARIGCNKQHKKNSHPREFNSNLLIIGTGTNTTVVMNNLEFTRVNITVINCNIVIKNSIFHSSKLLVLTLLEGTKYFTITNTRWDGFTFCETDKCLPSGEITLNGTFNNVDITNNVFSNTNLTIYLLHDCDVNLDSNYLTNDKADLPLENSIFITLLFDADDSRITVNNSVFEHQYHWNPVESVMNIFEASFLLRYSPQTTPINNITVLIENCTFFDNERGMTFQGPIENLNIINCTFRSNIAMHAGAGILLLTGKKVLIESSLFEHNAAGRFRTANVRPPGDYFKVDGDEAYVYSNCCKGSISLIGKGGAIRVQKSNVILLRSKFVNNSATILGGSIFVDRSFKIWIEDTDFMNGDSITYAAQQGDIIYSNGKVEINGARFNVKSAANHISLLQHSGDHWSIGVYNISIECPMGYRLRIMNTSAYQVKPNKGLMRSYMLDQLAYFCESCPRYKYSLERGSFLYQMPPNEPGYITLMINGENPISEFQGAYKYSDIVCKKCPYGGNCDNDQLKSLPNFWGYKHNGEVKFQLCPKGYCCSLKSCPSYNSCAKFRTGQLCAECKEGYSEALFSPKCIPNISCGPIWIWFLPVGMGLLYGLLLFFQKDIRDFIFAMPALSCKNNNSTSNNNKEVGDESIKNKTEEKRFLDHNLSHQSPLLSAENKSAELSARGFSTYREEQFNASDNGIVQNGKSQKQGTEEIDIYGRVALKEGIIGDDEMDESEENDSDPPAPSANDFGAIMLITILYYFQDAQLLHVKTAFAAEENPKWSMIKAILLGLFKFRIEIAHFLDSVCLIAGLSASVKLLAKTLLVPYVLVLFGILFLSHCFFSNICMRKKSSSKKKETCADSNKSLTVKENEEEVDPEKTFLSRLAMGFMLALLFTYQMLATTAFKLLNCVPVGNDSVLFIDGTVSCYQHWQYGVLTYAMTCIVPFSFVLMLGPGLLQEGRISLPTFFTACIFPFPFVIVWFLLRLCKKDTCLSKKDDYPTEPGKVVIKVLQGPFKDIENKITGPICWAGVLIFRRLLLVLLYTFINISLLRIIAMLLVCFIVLLNQVHVKPYRDSRANVAQSASIAALMFVGGINLVRAGFEAAEYTPHGPYKMLIVVMQETENTLMLWIPLVFMVVMGVILAAKICCYTIKGLSNWCNPHKNVTHDKDKI